MTLRILFISTRVYPDLGGVAIQIYVLSKYLSNNNVEVVNLTSKINSKSYKKKEKINNHYKIYYLPFRAPGANASALKLISFFIKYFIYGLIKVIKINRRDKIDLIHAVSPPPAGFISYCIYRLFKIPYIYTIHGLDYPNPLLLHLDIKFTARNSKRMISISKKIENILKNNFKLQNVYWLPNTIDISNYTHIKSLKDKEKIIKNQKIDELLDKEDFIIVYIGYMTFYQKVKGMIDFLYAFSKFIKNKKPTEKEKIKLLYIGEGKYSDLLLNKIKELNLKQNVFFLGKRYDIKELLSISDLLALTSYIEGFPNVLLEAMASEVPCLASDAGDNKQIIDNTGFIVKPGDIENITKFLEYYYRLPIDKKKILMEKSFKRVESHFDIKLIGKKLVKLYEIFKIS